MNLLRKMLLAVATLAVPQSSAHAQTRLVAFYQPSYGNYALYNRPYYWQPNLGGGYGYFGSMSLGGYGYYQPAYYSGAMRGYTGGMYAPSYYGAGYSYAPSYASYGGASSMDCGVGYATGDCDESYRVRRRCAIYPAVVVSPDFDLRKYLAEEKQEPKDPKK